MFGLFKNRERERDLIEGYRLLMGAKVYTWGKDWDPDTPDGSDERFMSLILQRPRVQISVDSHQAKQIMTWQHRMMTQYGDKPATEFPSSVSED